MAQEYDTAELIYFQTATEVERGDAHIHHLVFSFVWAIEVVENTSIIALWDLKSHIETEALL